MDLHAVVRIINGLKAAGWDDKAILDFILWVLSGEKSTYRTRETIEDSVVVIIILALIDGKPIGRSRPFLYPH